MKYFLERSFQIKDNLRRGMLILTVLLLVSMSLFAMPSTVQAVGTI
jgi:hypothetical protein